MKFKLQPVFKQLEASIPNFKTREKSLAADALRLRARQTTPLKLN